MWRWCLLSWLLGAEGHAGFWFYRLGCDSVPRPDKNVMGNEPNVMPVTNEVKILGTRKGFYKPGLRMVTWPPVACGRQEHLVHVTAGFLQGDEKLDEDDQPSVKCDGKLAAFGIPNTKRRIFWWPGSTGMASEVNVTMLSADAYGPVDFYQLTVQPLMKDL
eukprot:Skav218209  [mRNA]  locus=scaffold2232:239111:243885:+ [translate_table: standard]